MSDSKGTDIKGTVLPAANRSQRNRPCLKHVDCQKNRPPDNLDKLYMLSKEPSP